MNKDDGFIMVGKKKKNNNNNRIVSKKEKSKNSGFTYKSYKTKKTGLPKDDISVTVIQNRIEEKRWFKLKEFCNNNIHIMFIL